MNEIKPGQYAVKGDKKYKVIAVDDDKVKLHSEATNTEFESRAAQLLASGYVLTDAVSTVSEENPAHDAAETFPTDSAKTSSASDASHSEKKEGQNPAQVVPAAGVGQGVDLLASVASETEDHNSSTSHAADPLATEALTISTAIATDTSAGQRRVRTPEEIMGDLKRRQEEEKAKVDQRYKEKIFKASQRLKPLPQKRIDALALLDGLRQAIREGSGNLFMTDDEADEFISNSVLAAQTLLSADAS